MTQLCVRKTNGRAVIVTDNFTSAQITKAGLRRATLEEAEKYVELKPRFERKEIRDIKLA